MHWSHHGSDQNNQTSSGKCSGLGSQPIYFWWKCTKGCNTWCMNLSRTSWWWKTSQHRSYLTSSGLSMSQRRSVRTVICAERNPDFSYRLFILRWFHISINHFLSPVSGIKHFTKEIQDLIFRQLQLNNTKKKKHLFVVSDWSNCKTRQFLIFKVHHVMRQKSFEHLLSLVQTAEKPQCLNVLVWIQQPVQVLGYFVCYLGLLHY